MTTKTKMQNIQKCLHENKVHININCNRHIISYERFIVMFNSNINSKIAENQWKLSGINGLIVEFIINYENVITLLKHDLSNSRCIGKKNNCFHYDIISRDKDSVNYFNIILSSKH
jgi:DNA-binding transcriptional regulator PaaX